ncbi:MAG TPA: hypothetical protein VIT45_01575 [Allosphingosinicella sp.]
MARMRSPSYPSISLAEAIELTRKIHEKSRTNMIDREAAAKDMGYSGITGRSLTVLAGLIQFGLLEKAGKGGVRVSRTTVDILHGLTDEIKKSALLKAGTSPALYQDIMERFPDGMPPENALRSYLIQRDFGDVAIGPAVSSFLETYRMLEDAKVFDSHGLGDEVDAESPAQVIQPETKMQPAASSHTAMSIATQGILAHDTLNKINMNIMGGRVHVNALLNRQGIEALERKLASLKELLDDEDERTEAERMLED